MPLSALPSVQFATIAPAGFRLLAALEEASLMSKLDLVITCGSEAHPPDDPHTLGCAYDVRSHDLTPAQKDMVLEYVMQVLGNPTQEATGGYITEKFFGFLEDQLTTNEHFHFQLRRSQTYP